MTDKKTFVQLIDDLPVESMTPLLLDFGQVTEVAKKADQTIAAKDKRINELERKNAELKEFRDKFLFLSDHLKRPKSKSVERRDDMSITGKLMLYWQDDGDVIIGVCKFDDTGGEPEGMISVEFCSLFAGGGRSEYTLNALLYLMAAMEKDNEARPIEQTK